MNCTFKKQITVILELTQEEFELHRAALYAAENSFTREDLRFEANQKALRKLQEHRAKLLAIEVK